MVLLTSFEKSKQLQDVMCFSACKWQPSGFNYLEAFFFAPIAKDERELRSSIYLKRDKKGTEQLDEHRYLEGLRVYRAKYLESLVHRKREISFWLAGLKKLDQAEVALCCWCPDTKASLAQVCDFGCFACHTGLAGQFLNEHFGVQVELDEDRKSKLVIDWRP